MRVIFIRHGESTGNAGVPCHDLGAIELTERGPGTGARSRRAGSQAPALIVTSPYTRTQQTAAPTIARFPGVPVEVWPIEEFTYLQPARWNGTRSAERMPHLERYWSAADPDYCDGEGAESFATLLRRCEAALARLAAMPPASLVYVFGHGQFIQAARAIVADAHLDDRGKDARLLAQGRAASDQQRAAGRIPLAWQALGMCAGDRRLNQRQRGRGASLITPVAAKSSLG
jgi:probable phosphoglycerate mutase